MTLYATEINAKGSHRSFRLTRTAAQPEIARQVRPTMVLPERDIREIVAAATQLDVTKGGRFSVGPSGLQVWSEAWTGPLGTRGDSEHVGSVDWSYNTPSMQFVTIYRVLVTASGAALGQTTDSVLAQVLGLAGLTPPADAVMPPVVTSAVPRDPFRSNLLRQRP